MKIIALFIAVLVIFSNINDEDNRLELFLNKIEKFLEIKEQMDTRWAMPNYNPKPEENDMLANGPINIVEDPQTGLRYSPTQGRIYDPKLQMGFDINSRIIYDLKTGKKYTLNELLKRKKIKNENLSKNILKSLKKI